MCSLKSAQSVKAVKNGKKYKERERDVYNVEMDVYDTLV